MSPITIDPESITWRDYRKFSAELRAMMPDAEESSFDELKSAMLLAAIKVGWLEVEGIEPGMSLEELDDLPARVVMPPMDAVFEFYSDMRSLDPN